MGSNRFNKVPDYTPKEERKKPEEVKLDFKPCCVCNVVITAGYYAPTEQGGACSKLCWDNYKKSKPSLIDYVILK
jgi:hypothetical protein